MYDDDISRNVRTHYTEQRLVRRPGYKGAATIWEEDEATAVLIELIGYFGLDRRNPLPPPPLGLPGAQDVDEEAMEALQLGLSYLVSLAKREGRGQRIRHDRMSEMLHARYRAGRESFREEDLEMATIEARRALDAGELYRKEARVYFIAAKVGPIKIGMAIDPVRRLKSLQTSHPEPLSILATSSGGPEREREYHKQFAGHRLHGEWFERCPEIDAEIKRLNSPSPTDPNTMGMDV